MMSDKPTPEEFERELIKHYKFVYGKINKPIPKKMEEVTIPREAKRLSGLYDE